MIGESRGTPGLEGVDARPEVQAVQTTGRFLTGWRGDHRGEDFHLVDFGVSIQSPWGAQAAGLRCSAARRTLSILKRTLLDG